MRLNTSTIDPLSSDVTRYSYDRPATQVGIVHFGIGAFHRGHQAWYTDLALDAGDRDWAITGVSLRSNAVARQMNPQDGSPSPSAPASAKPRAWSGRSATCLLPLARRRR